MNKIYLVRLKLQNQKGNKSNFIKKFINLIYNLRAL